MSLPSWMSRFGLTRSSIAFRTSVFPLSLRDQIGLDVLRGLRLSERVLDKQNHCQKREAADNKSTLEIMRAPLRVFTRRRVRSLI